MCIRIEIHTHHHEHYVIFDKGCVCVRLAYGGVWWRKGCFLFLSSGSRLFFYIKALFSLFNDLKLDKHRDLCVSLSQSHLLTNDSLRAHNLLQSLSEFALFTS